MRITLEIPDSEVVRNPKYAPDGISLIRIKQDPLVSFGSELHFFVRDEWIKAEEPE